MEFKRDETLAMPLTWKQWLQSDRALPDWSQAAQGLKDLFPGWHDGGKKKGFPKREKNKNLWVQLHKPMLGVHIITFRLPKDESDFTPSVDLRVWVNEKHPEVYERFAKGRDFTFLGSVSAKYSNQKPDSSFKSELAESGVSVRGVIHRIPLERIGLPGAQALAGLFVAFCEYANACGGESEAQVPSVVVPQQAIPESSARADHEGPVQMALERAEQSALESGAFDARDETDAREKVIASVVRRRGQPQFRQALLEAYGSRCAISGCDVVHTLEAAHITPYMGQHTDVVCNGLLLRADLHTLFDLGLLWIDPSTMQVQLHISLAGSSYADLQGLPLRLPVAESHHPNQDALLTHLRLTVREAKER